MELWIRSQDNYEANINKRLIKANDIALDYCGENDGYYILTNNIEVAYYHSEERALEVLDEIQKVIMPKYIISNFPNDKVKDLNQTFKYNYDYIQSDGNINIRELGNYIYEMPKE